MATEVFHPMISTVQVVIKSLMRGQFRENVIHYNYIPNGRPTVAELLLLLGEVNTAVVTGLQDVTSSLCNYYELTARDLTDSVGNQAALAINRSGSRGSSVAPGNVAVVMSKRTGIPGRSKRGRLYTHDLDETQLDGDNVTTALQALLVQLGVDMLLALVSSKYHPAVGSVKNGTSQPITSIQFDTLTDGQSRRLTGHGS